MKKKQFFGSFKIFIMLTILLVVLSYIYIYYLRGGGRTNTIRWLGVLFISSSSI